MVTQSSRQNCKKKTKSLAARLRKHNLTVALAPVILSAALASCTKDNAPVNETILSNKPSGTTVQSEIPANSSSDATVQSEIPVFVSLDLKNGAADSGLGPADVLANRPVVELVGRNYLKASYAVVASTSTCDETHSYVEQVPTAGVLVATEGNLKKVCTKLENSSGKQAFGASPPIAINPTDPAAPALTVTSPEADALVKNTVTVQGTCESKLNVSVSGNDVFDARRSAYCDAEGKYSIPVTLTEADGLKVILVSSSNSTGATQVVTRTFVKDTAAPEVLIGSPTKLEANSNTKFMFLVSFKDASRLTSPDASKVKMITRGGVSCDFSATLVEQHAVVAELSRCSGNGSVGVSVDAGAVKDALGLASVAANSNIMVNIDHTVPIPTLKALDGAALSFAKPGSKLMGTCEGDFEVKLHGNVAPDQKTACLDGRFMFDSWSLSGSQSNKTIWVSQTDLSENVGYSSSVGVLPSAPLLTASNVTGLHAVLAGSCDGTASSHKATTTSGSVQSAECNAGVLKIVLHLPPGSSPFSVTVSADNSYGSNAATPVEFTRTAFVCPQGYVGVPRSESSGLGSGLANGDQASPSWLNVNKDFCVMKYPAKQKSDSTAAVSSVNELPWVNIARGDNETTANSAFKACAENGPGYRLISNTQWQTVARNAEGVLRNWTNNSLGSGYLVHGNSGSSTLLGNAPDNQPYFGTSYSDSSEPHFRRTHILSNGEVVWDFSGNLKQWVSDNYNSLGISPEILQTGDFEYSRTTTGPTDYFFLGSKNQGIFGPAGQYHSSHRAGNARFLTQTKIAVKRSGRYLPCYYCNQASGLYMSWIEDSTSAAADTGFRCAFVP